MAAKDNNKSAVTDEQLGKLSRKWRNLQELVEKGVVPFGVADEGLGLLAENKFQLNTNDPTEAYRGIAGLTIIGPVELEQVFTGSNGDHPLGLQPGWCTRISVPLSVKEMRSRVKLARKWKTAATLFLDIPAVAGQATSLENQYNWFGVANNGRARGIVRPDIFWSNWFMNRNYDWALSASVLKPAWKIKYELPNWSVRKNWEDQQTAVQTHNLNISSATSDALYLNLTRALIGRNLRLGTCARTATMCDRCPLGVYSLSDGVRVSRVWFPEDVHDDLGAAVEEVLGPLAAEA